MNNQNQIFTDSNGNSFVMQNGALVQVQPAGTNQVLAPQQPVPQEQFTGSGFNTMVQGFIVGHLGADPDFRIANSNGRLCCNFRVAVNKVYTKGEGATAQVIKKKSWLKVACFGKAAEKQQGILRKGSWVLVTFDWVENNVYQDKTNPAITRTSTEFYADRVTWLFKRDQNAYAGAPVQGQHMPVAGQQPAGQQFVPQGNQVVNQQPAAGYDPYSQPGDANGNTYNGL